MNITVNILAASKVASIPGDHGAHAQVNAGGSFPEGGAADRTRRQAKRRKYTVGRWI